MFKNKFRIRVKHYTSDLYNLQYRYYWYFPFWININQLSFDREEFYTWYDRLDAENLACKIQSIESLKEYKEKIKKLKIYKKDKYKKYLPVYKVKEFTNGKGCNNYERI